MTAERDVIPRKTSILFLFGKNSFETGFGIFSLFDVKGLLIALRIYLINLSTNFTIFLLLPFADEYYCYRCKYHPYSDCFVVVNVTLSCSSKSRLRISLCPPIVVRNSSRHIIVLFHFSSRYEIPFLTVTCLRILLK